MKAIILYEPGGLNNFKIAEIETPQIADNEVLVQVKAISINPVDVKTRTGKGLYGRLKELSPLIIGWDIAGIITQKGKDVLDFEVGYEVFGMVNFPGHGKAYAEYVAVPANQLALKPTSISFEEAAAATLAALTAWQALVTNAKVKSGDRVLIHGAAGGVGHYAIQIAKFLGAYVIGTSSANNKDFVLSLGADEHIDYQKQAFEEATADLDFVLDTIGGDNIDRSLEIIKPGGTLISIPSGLNEAVTEKSKMKSVNGYFMLVQSSGEDMSKLAELLESGALKSHVSATFNFDEMSKAHLQIETGRTRGKIIIKV